MAWCVCTPWVFECVCWQEITVRGGEMAGFSRPGKVENLGPKKSKTCDSCDILRHDRLQWPDPPGGCRHCAVWKPRSWGPQIEIMFKLFSSLSCREILKAWKEVLKRAILIKDHQSHNYTHNLKELSCQAVNHSLLCRRFGLCLDPCTQTGLMLSRFVLKALWGVGGELGCKDPCRSKFLALGLRLYLFLSNIEQLWSNLSRESPARVGDVWMFGPSPERPPCQFFSSGIDVEQSFLSGSQTAVIGSVIHFAALMFSD